MKYRKNNNTLSDLKPGIEAIISGYTLDGGIRRRLIDIGLTKGALVRCVGRSPCGDPSAYLIRGAVIAIRSDEAEHIEIAPAI